MGASVKGQILDNLVGRWPFQSLSVKRDGLERVAAATFYLIDVPIIFHVTLKDELSVTIEGCYAFDGLTAWSAHRTRRGTSD